MDERIELIKTWVETIPDITDRLIDGIKDSKESQFLVARFADGKEVFVFTNKDHPEDVVWTESSGSPESEPVEEERDKSTLPPVKLILREKFPPVKVGESYSVVYKIKKRPREIRTSDSHLN